MGMAPALRIEVLEAASGEERITMEIPNDSEVTYYRAPILATMGGLERGISGATLMST